jgi:hypothetical protein
LFRQGCQFRPAAVERRLDTAHSGVNQFRDFFERVVKNVLQKHTGAFLRRKTQHEVFDGAPKFVSGRLDWPDPIRLHDGYFYFVPNVSAAQEINATIMRNSEQPRGERTAIVELIQLSISLKQSLLDYVLAVQDRTGHPCTITVQAGAERSDRFEECEVPGLEGAGNTRGAWIIHIYHYASEGV